MKSTRQAIRPIIGCLIVQMCVGIIYLWSVFNSAVVASFDWTANAAKMVSSYMLLGFVTGSLAGGFLNDKKGPKFTATIGVILFAAGVALTGLLTKDSIALMYLTYCAMGGMGSGFAYSACISCVQKWMPHKRGLASGLAASAFGLSTVLFAPLSKWLMGIFTDDAGLVVFKPVFLILAATFFTAGIIGCILIKRPSAEYTKQLTQSVPAAATGRDLTLGQAVKKVPFWCIFFSILFMNGTWNLAVPMIYDLGMERGLSAAAATFCVSFTGVPNAAGRLVMAAVSDKIGRARSVGILAAATAVCALLLTFVGGYGFIVVIAVTAFAYGGPSAINAAMNTDFFGAKNSGTNYGVIMLSLGLSSVFFNFVASRFLDGAIVPTFIMAAVTAVIAIGMMVIIEICQKRERAQTQE